jgi:cell division protease FtsH
MIMDHGMSGRFRNAVLRSTRQNPFGAAYPDGAGPREISEATQQYVDDQVAGVLRTRYDRALSILRERRELLRKVAARLVEKETLSDKEFRDLIKDDVGALAPFPV